MKAMLTPGQRGGSHLAVLISLTFLNVALQLASAALIKFAAISQQSASLAIAALLAGVLALNAGRFVVWNSIHKRFPISLAYPLSATFFPAVVLLAWSMGEQVGAQQLVGALMVMAGVVWILFPGGKVEASLDA